MTTQAQSALVELVPLTEEQRQSARERARRMIERKHGGKPERTAFQDATISEYPAWLTRAINGMLALAFIGAFLTSAFSVFSAGRNHAENVLHVGWQAAAAGTAIVLLAEFLVISSVLAMQILLQGKRRRWLMLLPIALGTTIAICGNWVMAQPGSFWDYLITTAPPLAVVFLSLILEAVALDDIKRRYANEAAYQAALQAWHELTANPEESPHWPQAFANALRDALRAAYTKGRGKRDKLAYLETLTPEDWRYLVWRELQADDWYALPPEEAARPKVSSLEAVQIQAVDTIKPPAPMLAASNGNGHKS